MHRWAQSKAVKAAACSEFYCGRIAAALACRTRSGRRKNKRRVRRAIMALRPLKKAGRGSVG